jgi:hypothetical protein
MSKDTPTIEQFAETCRVIITNNGMCKDSDFNCARCPAHWEYNEDCLGCVGSGFASIVDTTMEEYDLVAIISAMEWLEQHGLLTDEPTLERAEK